MQARRPKQAPNPVIVGPLLAVKLGEVVTLSLTQNHLVVARISQSTMPSNLIKVENQTGLSLTVNVYAPNRPAKSPSLLARYQMDAQTGTLLFTLPSGYQSCFVQVSYSP